MAGNTQSDINANQFHMTSDVSSLQHLLAASKEMTYTYTFENFFHPFVGELIERLNEKSLDGLLDAGFHQELGDPQHTPSSALPGSYYTPNPKSSDKLDVLFHNKEIDVSLGGPYACYNWELFFHIPLTIAVHLSKNQRFAEAQRWFHTIFDPTCNDTSTPPPRRFWKFLAFRKDGVTQIDELLALLSTPDSELDAEQQKLKQSMLDGYQAILDEPFRPHAVARTRQLAYQYNVVMKYLDNLIAWGDSLFRQDTLETLNEATQLYVLAANILGARPQRIPPRGTVRPKTFAELKKLDLNVLDNAWVELQVAFPNLSLPQSGESDPEATGSLFGVGRALYFCVPHNERLLGYWDTVADRLFKIRHCMNIEGVVRQLALFDPPLDPGMLVKAVAAGIDIGSIVSGLNQPVGPVRSLFLMQKALELAGEVRGLGGALLSAIEKGDSEHMALLRQGHEIQIQQLAQEVRFLQWKQAQEATESLLQSRTSTLERYDYYLRLLGTARDTSIAPDDLELVRAELTEESFDEVYATLVEQYEKAIPVLAYPQMRLAGGSSPANQSGVSGLGGLYLNTNENIDLNEHAPDSRWDMDAANVASAIGQASILLPDIKINIHYWGLGGTTDIPIGELFARTAAIASSSYNTSSRIHDSKGASAVKMASYERRADEWLLQANLAAHELVQNGRQIIGALIAEQVAYHEYLNIQKQIAQSQEVDQHLREKFSNEELYLWMQGELSRLYYEYYRFAFDTARRAEQAMKRELMRPEVDATSYVKFNYWDGGRKGLLSGEALYLDIKRMEMAYHENNKREYELTRHVSLRQLDPVALLTLKDTGSCDITLPEWLFDLDGPGHYMRRIKSVSLSIPSVTGPYTSVSCTLSLLKSSLRKSPDGDYPREGTEDARFVDTFGAIQSIVTSNAQNDSGMFETNLRDERFLPFEGAGAVSTWKLELPNDYRTFDYNTISDVVLHIRYTARRGVAPDKVKTALDEFFEQAEQSGLALLFSLRHDFPTEWSAFVNSTNDFTATIRKDYFPYFAQGKEIAITGLELFDQDVDKHHSVGNQSMWDAATASLNDEKMYAFTIAAAPDESPDPVLVPEADAQVFLIVRYALA